MRPSAVAIDFADYEHTNYPRQSDPDTALPLYHSSMADERHADVSVSRPSRTTSKAHPTTTTTMRERASITRRTRVSSEPTLAVGACPSRRCRRRPLLYVLGLVAASYTTDGIVARIFDAKHGACRPNHLHTALVLDSFPQNRRLQHCRLGRGSFWQIRLALSQTRVLL